MFEGDSTEGDGGFTVSVEGVDTEDFGFGLVDGQKEELSGSFEGEDKAFKALSRVTDDSHIICIKEDLEKEVDLIGPNWSDTELAVNSVTEGHTIRGVGEGNADDIVEEDGEEGRGEDTALAYAVVGDERIRDAAIGSDRGVSVGVEIPKEAKNLGRETRAFTDKPQRITIDVVVSFEKIDEAGVNGDAELKGTAENLAEDEDLVCGTARLTEARLVLKDGCLQALGDTGVEDESVDFAGDREEANTPVTTTLKATALFF